MERGNCQEVLNEIEASKLSDIDFKIMVVIRKLNEFSENFK